MLSEMAERGSADVDRQAAVDQLGGEQPPEIEGREDLAVEGWGGLSDRLAEPPQEADHGAGRDDGRAGGPWPSVTGGPPAPPETVTAGTLTPCALTEQPAMLLAAARTRAASSAAAPAP
jgi:hypothetical protein